MHPFREGHKVRIANPQTSNAKSAFDDYNWNTETELEVIGWDETSEYNVNVGTESASRWVHYSELKFLTDHSIGMANTNATENASKFLDKDGKALLEAGFMDTSMNITPEGAVVLNSILLDLGRAELVKRAHAKIKESKDSK